MSYLNLQLGDFLTPSAPLQTGEVIDKNLRMTMSFKIAAHDRKTLLVEDLQNSIDKFQIYYRENDSRTIEKLEVALNLYSNYFRQRSIISRFLTLVMAIEALAPQAPRPTTVFNLIEKWTKEIQMLYSIYDEDSEEHSALQNLEREIAFRRHDSIRGSIRKYVLDALSRRGNPEAKVWSRRAVEIYDLRSKLVHEGALSVSELQYAEKQKKKIVKLLLHALVDKSD